MERRFAFTLLAALLVSCRETPTSPPDAGDGCGAATKLIFTSQPSRTAAAAQLAPTVQVAQVNACGAVVTKPETRVTLVLGINPHEAVLTAPEEETKHGVATFSELAVSNEAVAMTLVASAPGLSSATSVPFDVFDDVPPSSTQLRVTPGHRSLIVEWDSPTDDAFSGDNEGGRVRLCVGATPTSMTCLDSLDGGLSASAPSSFPEHATLTGLASKRSYEVRLEVFDGAGNSTVESVRGTTLP